MLNWVDFTVFVIIVFFIIEGLERSFFSELLDFLSFLLAFILSLRFYNAAAVFFTSNFGVPHSLSNVLGFALTWFLVETVFLIFVQFLLLRSPFLRLKRFSVLGTIPSVLRGLVLVTVLLLIVGTFPVQPQIKQSVQNSFFGSKILHYAGGFELPLKNVFGGITTDSLTFLTIKTESDERVDLGFKTVDFYPAPQLEEQMIGFVNNERMKLGIKPLQFNPALREIARSHSTDMFKRGYFSHYSPEGKSVADRSSNYGVDYLVIGENLAYAPNLELAHNGLMNSLGHRANILSGDYNQIGIGIMEGGIYGLMITQVFKD